MAGAILIIFVILGVGYIINQSGGGYVDSASGVGPRSSSSIVNSLAIAIAHAEGFYVPASRPARNHNPGDISDRYLASGVDGPLAVFPDDQTGWDALTHKLENILSGMSTTYPLSDTIASLAQTWTGGDNAQAWATNVAQRLGVGTDNTLSDLAVASGDFSA
jgi:hypothetical protein